MKKITSMMFLFFFSVAIFAQQGKEKKFINLEKSTPKSIKNAKQLIRTNLKLSSEEELVKTKTVQDELGFTHEKYQQFFKGIKVEFGTYAVHAKNGIIKTMNGELFSAGKLNIVPSLSKSSAFQRAISHTGADHYLWEYPEEAKEMDNYKKPEGELVILGAKAIGTEKAHLAYKFDIYATQPLSRGYLYIDAHTGESLFFNAIIKHASTFGHIGEVSNINKTTTETIINSIMVSGSAKTRYSGTRSIETALSGSNYILSDAGRKVYTRDAKHQNSNYTSNYDEFTDNDNDWTTAEHSANKDNAALDAHWGAMMTYDYFKGKHSRDSYDGNGAQIRSYVHVRNNYDNAFWNGSVMSYGDGSSNGNEGNGNFDALTSIDVAAHEIGHAICSNTADLAYQRESGGLNEGFSDIWGAAVEHFAKGNGSDLAPDATIWLIGDEIDRRSNSAALRSMSDPKLLGQPDTYRGTNWKAATAAEGCATPNGNPNSPGYNDSCGVHTNSGVLNHWFYLLTVGGSGSNDNNDSFNVTRIGMAKSTKIAYRTETVYLSSNSTFADARTAAITSATDLYGAGSQEVISTTNAWYAVGVGTEYVQTCSLSAPSNFTASNINDNGFTLSWNAVSGAVSYDVIVDGNTTNVSTTSHVASGLSAGTQYNCTVVAKCASGEGSSSNTDVTTTGATSATYCDSASTNTNDEYISRVQLGSIDNTSAATFYSDFTGKSTNLVKGASSTITVTPTWTSTSYNEGYAVWIDYNQDGDFADSGEQVWSKSASKTTPASGSFTVPASAVNGATRMRVSMKYNGIPTSCETLNYGEVEDYTVNITNGTTNNTDTTVVLTLAFDNYSEETSWEIQDSSNSIVASGGTYTSQANTTLNINVELPKGCYSLIMKDVYGDGMCCTYGNGSYTLKDGSTTLVNGATFKSSETKSFCVGGATSATFGELVESTNSETTKSIFEVFPNPVGEKLNISLHGFEAQSYQVFNSLGSVILKGRYSNAIDVSRLPLGIYMIQLNIGEKTKVKRFIKK